MVATGLAPRGRRIIALAVVGAAVVGLLGGCSVEDVFYFGWPKDHITPQSNRMYNLWLGSTVAAMAVGVFVWGLIFWCIIRYRKRGETLPSQTRYNLPIELIYSVAPFLIVSVLFYYTAIIQTDVNRLRPDPDVVVDINAFKWNWQFVYEGVRGPDGQEVRTTGASDYVPVLVLPTGKRIRFVEHSSDVIHSFWVPNMLFKRDVFPGNVVNQFEVSIDQVGSYVGRCAELCGAYHSMMSFELRAVTPEQYTLFLAAKQRGATTPEALAAAGFEGKDLYATTTEPFDTKRNAANQPGGDR